MGVDLGVAGRTLQTETVRRWRGEGRVGNAGWGQRGFGGAGARAAGGSPAREKKKSGRCQLIRGGRRARRAAATPRGGPRGCLARVVALERVDARAREALGARGSVARAPGSARGTLICGC